MRHRIYGKHLGRNKDERDRLFKGLVSQLLLHGTIQTSENKAKAIKGLVDKVINFAKAKNFANIKPIVNDKNLQERLIKEIAPKMENRGSGYTSLVRLGTRLGDQTMMVKMSLIGAEELKPIQKESRVKSQKSSKKVVKVETKKPSRIRRVKQTVKVATKGGKKS